MTLGVCPECQQPLSDKAVACPHCGAVGQAHPFKAGWGFEWRTEAEVFGLPLVHVAVGRKPGGGLRVAKGIIAIGQFGVGVVTIAQFGVGLLFGFGQFLVGLTAVAQFAGAVVFGLGQFASGDVAIGQLVLADYGLCQMGLARHLWSQEQADPEAVRFFCDLFASLDLHGFPARCG